MASRSSTPKKSLAPSTSSTAPIRSLPGSSRSPLSNEVMKLYRPPLMGGSMNNQSIEFYEAAAHQRFAEVAEENLARAVEIRKLYAGE
jgi:hypothetical protein